MSRFLQPACLAVLLPAAMLPGWLPAALPPAPATAVAAQPLPQHGDVVLRRGNGFWSGVFARLNPRDRRYSHVGIVVADGAALEVVHAEADDDGTNGSVRRDGFAAFAAASSGIVLLRLDDRAAAAGVADAARAMFTAGLPFDFDFDLDDGGAVYCAELAWRALRQALGRDPLPDKPRVAGRRAILIENFIEDMPELREVRAAHPAPLPGDPL